MDRSDIEQLIPHREPFLWIDEVTGFDTESLTARKLVSPELDVFRGHYPDRPILPGVLICEAAFQAGALLIARIAELEENQVPVVTRLNNVKFRRVVRPGETLDIEVRLREQIAGAFFLDAVVRVEGQVAVRLDFGCTTTVVDE